MHLVHDLAHGTGVDRNLLDPLAAIPFVGAGVKIVEGVEAADVAIADAVRLTEAEQATAGRLMELLGIELQESSHIGAEYVDALGRTYDALGTPAASQFWNAEQFTNSIASHLLKSNDFTVIDLTGFTSGQIAEVNAYLGTLSDAQLARIIKVGF